MEKPAMTTWLSEAAPLAEGPAASATASTAKPRSQEIEELVGRMRELEEENSRLRSEVDQFPNGGPRAASKSGCSSRSGSLLETSNSLRRSVSIQDAAMAKLNEALVENEEVLEKNRELNEEIESLRRAQSLDHERQMEQESALQELTSKMKVLEVEKRGLQNDLQGFNLQKVRACKWEHFLEQAAEKPEQLSDQLSEQPEAEPRPCTPRKRNGLAHSVEASGLEAQILGLQEEIRRLQLENQQLLGMCTELRAMFEAERQAAEQSRLEAELLQDKLACERMRRRAVLLTGSRSSLRSSSSRSQGTDLMHQLAAAGRVAKDPCDSASASSCEREVPAFPAAPCGERASGWLLEEELVEGEGVCEWLHKPDDQLKSPRPLTLELLEAPTKPGRAEEAAEEPWWWERLFGSVVCCRRPPAVRRSQPPPREVPVFTGITVTLS